MTKIPVGVNSEGRRLELTGPHPAREAGICGMCTSAEMFTMRGNLKSTARVYKAVIGYVRITLCAACLAALGAEIQKCVKEDIEWESR